MQLSLTSIEGTGPDGGIVKADVEAYLGNDVNMALFLSLFCLLMCLLVLTSSDVMHSVK